MGEKTPLYDFHVKQQAKIVDFAGYALPVSYKSGIVAEHKLVREKAGLFDVSHMGLVEIEGPGATDALEKLLPADLERLTPGKMAYSFLVNERGGIIDDLIITKIEENRFRIVLNASRKSQDEQWIKDHLPSDVTLSWPAESAILALQGPLSASVLEKLFPNEADEAFISQSFMSMQSFQKDGENFYISRCGYTGGDGFEICVSPAGALGLAEKLVEVGGVAPVGLGARDTLRLEAGLPLYGNDLDETTSPVEAGLSWTIPARRREKGGFIGEKVILDQIKNQTAPRKRQGFRPEGKMPVRQGSDILTEKDEPLGLVTSGGFSPLLEAPVAMGYVKAGRVKKGDNVFLVTRGKKIPAKISGLPFVAHSYSG